MSNETTASRRSSRRRSLKKDQDTEYEYDFDCIKENMTILPDSPPKECERTRGTKRKSAEKLETYKYVDFKSLSPKEYIDARVEYLEKRAKKEEEDTYKNLSTKQFSSNVPSSTNQQYLGSNSRIYPTGESNETAVKTVLDRMLNVVCIFQKI